MRPRQSMLPRTNFSGMVRVEPRLAFAVADLLPPVRLDRRTMVMPDERRRREADPLALGLQSPAHVHVVAGTEIDRVETADREQRVATERHVAAGNVLGDAIVEQHMRRPARRTRHALGNPGIVGRNHVRTARADHIRGEERLHQVGQPVGLDANVSVGVGDDLAGRFGQADIARGAQAAVRDGDDADQAGLPRSGGLLPRSVRRSHRSDRASRR